jgi:hypothetical protein
MHICNEIVGRVFCSEWYAVCGNNSNISEIYEKLSLSQIFHKKVRKSGESGIKWDKV